MDNTVKIYGKCIRIWKDTDETCKSKPCQFEIEYKEYYLDGTLKQTGTEDFSADRYNKTIREKWLWTWDGQKRNKGGHRWFECQGQIKFDYHHRQELKRYLENKYQGKEIQLR